MNFILFLYPTINPKYLSLNYCSQSSKTNNDGWEGFENGYQDSGYQSSTAKQTTSIRSTSSSVTAKQSRQIDDFDALDVKASKTKAPDTNKPTKSIEDDAWNLLNN